MKDKEGRSNQLVNECKQIVGKHKEETLKVRTLKRSKRCTPEY